MRRIAAPILAVALLALSAVPTFGAVDQSKLQEIKALTQQMQTIRVQIIEKKVDAGILDPAKAEKIKSAIQERQKQIEQDIDNGKFDRHHKKGSCGKPSAPPQNAQ